MHMPVTNINKSKEINTSKLFQQMRTTTESMITL